MLIYTSGVIRILNEEAV